jgi:tetratricopeptide (TPR) repeat protein
MLYEKVLTEKNDVDRLERLHREELDAPCFFPEDYLRRTHRLLALNRPEDAREAAESGFALEARNPELRFNHAMASLRLDDEATALGSLRLMQAGNSETHVAGLATEAALLEKRGELDAAIEALDRWLGFDPQSTEGILRKAKLQLAAGREAEARATLETAASDDRRVALELAGMLLRSGDVAGAGRVASLALQ